MSRNLKIGRTGKKTKVPATAGHLTIIVIRGIELQTVQICQPRLSFFPGLSKFGLKNGVNFHLSHRWGAAHGLLNIDIEAARRHPMAQPIAIKEDARFWSPRARLYGMALVITLSYMLMGRLNNDNDSWVQVNLPFSSASLLLVSLAAAEMYIYVQRVQRHNTELQLARDRELELSQR